jgi:hypothetical protein
MFLNLLGRRYSPMAVCEREERQRENGICGDEEIVGVNGICDRNGFDC